MRNQLFSITVALFVLTELLHAQQSVTSQQNSVPPEMIHIHYDKEYYVAGETIWLKAYLYNDGMPSGVSNNFFLQLVDQRGRVVSAKKYPVKGATATGNIDLVDTIAQGYYYIRAITPALLESGEAALYSKQFFIYNPTTKVAAVAPRDTTGLSVQFFPESGNLIDGIMTVVGFKAVNGAGRAMEIVGTIRTDDSTNITTFKTFYDGMGKVQFRPQAGKKYFAMVDVNGKSIYLPLPGVENSGINLKLDDEKGGKVFQLSRSKMRKDDFKIIKIIAELNGKNVYEKEVDFEDFPSVKGHLITSDMPSGVLQFRVLNADNMPLAERTCFINNREYDAGASLTVVKENLSPRGENILNIQFPSKGQRSCSVAITDIDATGTGKKTSTIQSSLLLTNYLKGDVYNPAYYFEQRTDSVRQQQALDHLMMIHTWTRFNWIKNVPGNQKKYPDPYLIGIKGNIVDRKTNEAVKGGELTVYLEAEDSTQQNFDIAVDNKGGFSIDSVLFNGKGIFSYEYKTNQGKPRAVTVRFESQLLDSVIASLQYNPDSSSFKKAEAWAPPSAMIERAHRTVQSKMGEVKNLETVVVQSKSSKRPLDIVNEQYSNGLFRSLGKQNFDLVTDPPVNKTMSAYDFVRQNVRQIDVQDNNFVSRRNFSLFAALTPERAKEKQAKVDSMNVGSPPGSVLNTELDPGKKFIVSVFLNESQTDPSFLKTINMGDVALVKFFDAGFAGSSSDGPGGAVAVYTKDRTIVGEKKEKMDQLTYKGYSIVKEFYSPDYSQPNPRHDLKDERSTIYWNPSVYVDAGSDNVQIRFFNSDPAKRIRIVVEGFDATGKLVYIEKDLGK